MKGEGEKGRRRDGETKRRRDEETKRRRDKVRFIFVKIILFWVKNLLFLI